MRRRASLFRTLLRFNVVWVFVIIWRAALSGDWIVYALALLSALVAVAMLWLALWAGRRPHD